MCCEGVAHVGWHRWRESFLSEAKVAHCTGTGGYTRAWGGLSSYSGFVFELFHCFVVARVPRDARSFGMVAKAKATVAAARAL